MSSYLVIGGWNSRRKIPVNVLGETAEGLQIEVLERIFLPGRGFLEEGQSTVVSKIIVKAARRTAETSTMVADS